MERDEELILKDIIKACRDSVKPVRKEEIKRLQELLDKLNKVVTNKVDPYTGLDEKAREYWSNARLNNAYIVKGITYPELLEIVTEILDILRGIPLEILIQKTQRNKQGQITNITVYRGKETNLKTKNYQGDVQYDLTESLKNFKKIEKANQSFINHYSQFYNIAQEHIKSTRAQTKYKQKWRKKINEGNIVEAFQRHMQIKHMQDNIETSSFNDTIIPRDVIVLLYYTIGNVPWWQQGDIGYLQVKANNLKLASQISVKRVASKLKDMFKDLEHFDVKEFNEIFTAKDQQQMVSFDDLAEEEQNKLIDIIVKDPNLKVQKKDFK